MRRIILALTVIALVAAMTGIGVLSVTAQEDPDQFDDEEPTDPFPWEDPDEFDEEEPTDPFPWEDTTEEPSEDEETEPPFAPQQEAWTVCAPEWHIYWEPWYSAEGAWWVGWWYQWCYTAGYGWWVSWDSWFWDGRIY